MKTIMENQLERKLEHEWILVFYRCLHCKEGWIITSTTPLGPQNPNIRFEIPKTMRVVVFGT